MSKSFIETQRAGAVGIITIQRPQRFNSLDVDTARDLRKAGLQFCRDEDVRAVILRGIPGIFCSGADLKYIRGGGDDEGLGYLVPSNGPDSPASQQSFGAVFKQILEYIHSTISEIKRAPKPFIAVIDGVAAAGGFGLAMSCDLVLASDRSTFEWAYAKTSLTGAESSTFFLPRLIGLRRAMEMVLLNPRYDAATALSLGLITAVYPYETLEAEALAVAKKLAEGPTAAYAVAKKLLNEAAGVDRLDLHLDRELEHLARIADTRNFREGIDAFFAKRQPEFSAK